MPSPSTLPLEARRAAWERLWNALLSPEEDAEEAEPVSEPDEATPADEAV